MAIALGLLLPYIIVTKKFKLPNSKLLITAIICGVLFASDVAVWNIAIQKSSATQATLLTNLAPVWVGIISYFFLKNKPATNFWIGTLVAILGMITLVGFSFFLKLNFDMAFSLAIVSGILYAIYILVSKNVLSEVDVYSFMTITLVTSTLFLGVVNYFVGEAFYGFSNDAWLVLFIQGAICQLAAWLLISYATQNMRATRVSLSLLSQGVIATFLAWLFIDEQVTLQMIIGGIILLFGISITFIENKKHEKHKNNRF